MGCFWFSNLQVAVFGGVPRSNIEFVNYCIGLLAQRSAMETALFRRLPTVYGFGFLFLYCFTTSVPLGPYPFFSPLISFTFLSPFLLLFILFDTFKLV